jgi:hypothetical protein
MRRGFTLSLGWAIEVVLRGNPTVTAVSAQAVAQFHRTTSDRLFFDRLVIDTLRTTLHVRGAAT